MVGCVYYIDLRQGYEYISKAYYTLKMLTPKYNSSIINWIILSVSRGPQTISFKF